MYGNTVMLWGTTTGEVQKRLEREGLNMELKFRRTGEGKLKEL